MLDLHNNISVRRAISPVATAANDTPVVSQIVDRQGFDSLELVILTGAIPDADATFAVLIEDGETPTLTDNVAVADEFLIGTEALAGFQFDDDNETRKIGYKGIKRYVRATITPANNTGATLIAAAWLLSTPRVAPVTT